MLYSSNCRNLSHFSSFCWQRISAPARILYRRLEKGGGRWRRDWEQGMKGRLTSDCKSLPFHKIFCRSWKNFRCSAARQSITLGPCCCTGYRCSMCTVPKSVWVKKMGEYVQTRVSLGTCPKLTMWYALTQMRKGYYGHISQIRIE